MDPTTALIVALALILAERQVSRALIVARLALDLTREQARTREALARLALLRAEVERRRALAVQIREAFLREVSPAMQRARLDPPAEVAGLLGRLSEEVDDGVRDP